ncbi:MAG: hypothetical protein JWN86_4042 [Planctomycetota bacterium]|nr:hypothetical protein [Planctomycetota bacterium]
MICAYCDRPLICDACGAEFRAVDPRQYEAMSRAEVAIDCPECEAILICHWCKTPYDGRDETEEG